MKAGSWPSILAIYLAGICGSATFSKLIPMASGLSRDFAMGPIQFAWLIGLFAIPAAIFAIPSGMVVERYGPRAVLVVAGIFGAAANGLYLIADESWLIYVARLFEGLAVVHAYTAAPALIMASTEGNRRTAAMTLWTTYTPVGTALGIATSGLFADGDNWRMGFACHGALLLLAAAINFLQPRIANPALASIGIKQRVAGLVRALGFRPIQLASLVFLLLVSLGIGVSVTQPDYLAHVHGLPLATTSSLVALTTLVMIPGSLATGALLANGVDARRLFTVASLAGLAAGILNYLPGLPFAARWVVLFAWFLTNGATLAVLMASLPVIADQPRRPALLALMNGAGAAATLCAPLLWRTILAGGNWLGFIPVLVVCWTLSMIAFGLARAGNTAGSEDLAGKAQTSSP